MTNVMADPKHPVWKLLRNVVVGGLLLGLLALTRDKISSSDLMTLLGVAAGLAGFDIGKDRLTRPKPSSPCDNDESADSSQGG